MPELNFPLKAKSVTGHNIVLYGESQDGLHYIGECQSRVGNKPWECSKFSKTTGRANSLRQTNSLDFRSCGIETTPENDSVIELYRDYVPSAAASATTLDGADHELDELEDDED